SSTRSPRASSTSVGEGVLAADADVELARGDRVEDVLGAPVEFLARARVVRRRRAGQVEGAAGVELLRIDRRHRPARRAEQGEQPAHLQAGQAAFVGVLAHAVVDDVDPGATGQVAGDLREVLAVVADDLVRARLA